MFRRLISLLRSFSEPVSWHPNPKSQLPNPFVWWSTNWYQMNDDMWRWIRLTLGMIEGLLLARLVGLLFAVRPDNWVFEVVLAITAPIVWPFEWLDRWAAQPRFGARLDLATIATMVLILLVSIVWELYRTARAKAGTRSDERT